MKRKIVVTAYLCIFVGCAWMASLFAASFHDTLEIKENKDRSIPPTNKKKLLKWLKAGTYLEIYTAEDQVHDSVGPHGGNVRTYYNPILVEDLQANKTVFRKGSTMVKELYFDGEEEVVGYAVMTKVRKKSGDEGQGWLFYETFDGTNNGAIFGKGLEECADCHSTGIDFLRSDFRP